VIEKFQFRWGTWEDLASGVVILLLIVFAASFHASVRRRRVLGIFGIDLDRASGWLRACARRRRIRAGLLVAALSCAGAAALQPRGNPEKADFTTRARDLAVVVDVSRSMLAEDLKPNRLERIKGEIARLAENLLGDRVGLIAFAGSAETLCHLTSSYSHFKSVLLNVDTNSADRGGTEIGDAIRKAVQLLGFTDSTHRSEESDVGKTVVEDEQERESHAFADILLITDGENHGLDPKYAVADAAANGVGLYIVGLGSRDGTPIPIRDKNGKVDYVRHQGEIVRTRLDETGLMELVNQAPRGRYLPVGTDNPDLVDFYEKTIAQETGREIVQERITWTELFQPFLLVGLLFYLLHLAVPERPARARSIRLMEVTGT